MDNKYIKKWYEKMTTASEAEIYDIINKIYEEGYEDGATSAGNEDTPFCAECAENISAKK